MPRLNAIVGLLRQFLQGMIKLNAKSISTLGIDCILPLCFHEQQVFAVQLCTKLEALRSEQIKARL